MVSGSMCCSVQGWIHSPIAPAELGGKASHLRGRSPRESDRQAQTSGQTRNRTPGQCRVLPHRLRAQVAGGEPHHIFSGSSSADILFMGRRYSVSEQGAIDSTLRFLLSMPRRSELVMGFVLPPDSWRPEEANFLTQVVRRAGELVEPWLTFLHPTRPRTT
jgi:hypothetical protein